MLHIDQVRVCWNHSKRKTAQNLQSIYLPHLRPDSIRKMGWFHVAYETIKAEKQAEMNTISCSVEAISNSKETQNFIAESQAHYQDNADQFYQNSRGETNIEELLDERCRKYRKKIDHDIETRIRTVAMGSKPIAILHLGDPHLDDDGCDLPLLREHIRLCNRAKGVYGGNIGDTTNNWVGRLEKLYAKQSTTLDDAIVLAEWLCKSMEWAYFVIGNHDSWNQSSYILKLLLRQSKVWATVGHECRLSLRFDNGAIVNICARHDHKGRSMYHSTHGALKAHIFGDRWADLHISGHTHQWGLMQVETEDGKPRWAIRVRGYKRMDDFAKEKGLYEHQHGSACLTVINPYAPVCDRIIGFWDVQTGLKYLESIR